ncbi:MAG: hypothetical protein K5746_02215 [Clostridiales bacterium]|nr:hypothetical protein [Clostridiales bacterium]
MKDFGDLVLCDRCVGRTHVYVWAELRDGKLTISGCDTGSFTEEFWGGSDYEYWYSLDRRNTEKLFSAIHGGADPQAALLREFGGEGGCGKLRAFCEENGIACRFDAYA